MFLFSVVGYSDPHCIQYKWNVRLCFYAQCYIQVSVLSLLCSQHLQEKMCNLILLLEPINAFSNLLSLQRRNNNLTSFYQCVDTKSVWEPIFQDSHKLQLLFSNQERICPLASHILEIRICTNKSSHICEKHIFVYLKGIFY